MRNFCEVQAGVHKPTGMRVAIKTVGVTCLHCGLGLWLESKYVTLKDFFAKEIPSTKLAFVVIDIC